jgi:hypothetical protein
MYEGGDPEGKLDVFCLSKGSESIVTADLFGQSFVRNTQKTFTERT